MSESVYLECLGATRAILECPGCLGLLTNPIQAEIAEGRSSYFGNSGFVVRLRGGISGCRVRNTKLCSPRYDG